MEEKKENKESLEKAKEQIEEIIDDIVEEKIQPDNIDYLYRLVDIHKDLANEEYWKIKKEDIKMRYRNYSEGSFGNNYGGYSAGGYGEYGEESFGRRGVPGTGRGRYREGSFGRRGVKGTGRGRYRGEEMMDEMMFHYGNYSESGQFGAEEETMKALEYMMQSVVDFIKMLKEEAKSPEEMEIIKHYSKKISEM